MSYNYEETKFHVEILEECSKKLKGENLRKLSVVAIDNLSQIAITLALPHFLMLRGVDNLKHLQYTIESAIKRKSNLRPKTAEEQKQLEEFVRSKFEENKKAHSDEGKKMLILLRKQNPYIENAIRIQALNSLVNIWTIFESTSKEIWINLLNESQNKFLTNILETSSDNDIEGLSGKNISIALLGKYNFDVNNKLGIVLSNKFDFTSCSGIKKAYMSLCRSKKSTFDILDDKNLLFLECLRNLIVHNAGIIDDSFLKKWPEFKNKAGKKILINNLVYSRLEKAAIVSMTKLFEFGDSEIQSK